MPEITEIPPDDGPVPRKGSPVQDIGNGDGPRATLDKESDDDDLSDMPPLEDFADDTPNKNQGKKIVIEDEEPKSTDEEGWLDILGSGELKKKVIKQGEGRDSRPQRSDWITINLTGKLSDGKVVERNENWKIVLGDLEVVCGLDMAMALMEKGEVAEVVVPPRFGYGALGKEPDIPPNATLHYEVELISSQTAKDETELPFEDRLRIGDQKRERGNFWYSRSECSNATRCYRRALDFLDDMGLNVSDSPKDLQQLLDLRLKVYNNLAAAQMKMGAHEAALKSVDTVLKVQPNNVKALFRKGKILAHQGDVSEAVDVLKRALKLEPETKVIQQELARLVVKKKTQDQAEKAMYRRMFASTPDKEEEQKKHSRSRARTWSLVAGAVVAMTAVGIATYKHFHL
ncbi:peptidyl-prolyl cis-trans isomerase FKBP8-like [Ornithodoros turicata]|uniref:peptidyl-prolyl cis-trans isomerase FKBP8-like n=1 Tax=Ornithodoros turicata TaxID=34597 RepID=UPI003139F6EC